MPPRPLAPYLVLALGVLIVSTASILIRAAQGEGVPSLTIAAIRLGVAALILTPIAWSKAARELMSLPRRDLWLALLSGAFLALHFWSWIGSLAYTSVASSTALVTTNPIWVGLASVLILGERLRRLAIASVALTLIGSALIFAGDATVESLARQPDPLLGNMLALFGAVTASGYLLIGRALRGRVGLLSYIWLAYSSAAVLLLLGTGIARQPLTGYSALAYGALLALALGPQLLGHTAFNWALRHLSVTFVAVSILGEPIGSALLALILFGETVGPLQSCGFVVLLAGIYLAARGEPAQRGEARPDAR